MTAFALSLHLLAAVVWVGGMFFAYMFLRPTAAEILEPELRLRLWSAIFSRFFRWVWASIIILPVTGYWIVFRNWGGFKFASIDIHLMHGIGLLMILIFLHLFFSPYRRLNRALANKDIKKAAQHLSQIRYIIAINMTLGLTVVIIASAGRYL